MYPQWRVTVDVANHRGIENMIVEIDAPDPFTAEADVTSMLFYGDEWEILQVQSVEAISA